MMLADNHGLVLPSSLFLFEKKGVLSNFWASWVGVRDQKLTTSSRSHLPVAFAFLGQPWNGATLLKSGRVSGFKSM
jgi:hypothetical protein